MKNTIGAIALVGGVIAATAAIALAGSTAFAGERFFEQRAELARLWGKDKAVTTDRAADTRANFTSVSSVLSIETCDPRAGNLRAGRFHPDSRIHPGGR